SVAKPDLVDSPIRRRCTPTLFPAILGLILLEYRRAMRLLREAIGWADIGAPFSLIAPGPRWRPRHTPEMLDVATPAVALDRVGSIKSAARTYRPVRLRDEGQWASRSARSFEQKLWLLSTATRKPPSERSFSRAKLIASSSFFLLSVIFLS